LAEFGAAPPPEASQEGRTFKLDFSGARVGARLDSRAKGARSWERRVRRRSVAGRIGAGSVTGESSASSDRSRATARAGQGRPPSLQVGALGFRRTAKGIRILLITSRDTGRWVIPKGWPMRNRTEAEAAAREAFEEAGLRGDISPKSIGHYTYYKWLDIGAVIPCVVRLYALEVRERVRRYPEIGQRKVRWFRPEKAARKVAEPGLARLIREFVPDQPIRR